jgi:cyclopropane-fatty-acyl-phospholipid synthase
VGALGRFRGQGLGGRIVERIVSRIDQINQRTASRRNVAHHYDLGDPLYDLFLDASRQYSCAYWADGVTTLEQAQIAKMDHIAAKLALKPGMRVLDIGCGWGGLALHLHRVAGVDVHGVTLSKEQIAYAKAWAEREGVADKVTFGLTDYRDVTGRFDRIVSVGMFEHVGAANFPAFFRKCHDLLADDGVMLLHTIGRSDPPAAPMPSPGNTSSRRLYPGDERDAGGDRAAQADAGRYRDPAPALWPDHPRMVQALRRQPGTDRGAL